MKRGQLGIGLVIFGVVAIIAVIGLVLLFTRASKDTSGSSIEEYRSENLPEWIEQPAEQPSIPESKDSISTETS